MESETEMDLTNFEALSQGYKAGAFTPLDVVNEVLARIEGAGDDHVWIARASAEKLRERAATLMAHRESGSAAELPLYGIPFAVKDNIDVAGYPTTAACPEFEYLPTADAPVVRKLIDAGGILVGKTNLDQFATGLTGTRSPYGVPRNPFGPDYIPGGSSSGSAVAVSSGLVTFSLGTDTAGSIRIPAGFNNIIGLKPTRGLLSTRGVVPACRSIDCVAVFAQDVRCAATVLRAAKGFDAEDPFSKHSEEQPRMRTVGRIGVIPLEQREFFGDEDAAEIYESGIGRLRSLGIECVDIDFRPYREAAELLYSGAWMAEREASVGEFIRRKPEAVITATKTAILSASHFTAADSFKHYYRLKELRRLTALTWDVVNAIFVPTAPTIFRVAEALADPAGLTMKLSHYTNFVNLLDFCALAVPSGFNSVGMPVGATFIAPAFHDDALIALQKQFEASTVVRRAPQALVRASS